MHGYTTTWVLALLAGSGSACFSNQNRAPTVQDGGSTVEDGGSTLEPRSNTCSTTAPCAATDGTCSQGVCVPPPPAGKTSGVTNPVGDKPTTDPPNLACLGKDPETPAGPAKATLYGAVARFGSGIITKDVEVNVYLAEGYDPSGCEAKASLDDRDACYDAYGTPIGTTTSVTATPTAPLPENCEEHSDCPLGYRCIEGDLDYACQEQYGVYEIKDVPLNTGLVLRARATTSYPWHATYTVNLYLYADNLEPDGRYHYDATIVSDAQWELTTNTVGLPEIKPDHGVVGGRVRDCRIAGTRDSWSVAEVSLALARPARKVVYYNDLEDDTVPLPDESSTDILGRFAALDIGTGWNTLSGVARLGTELVSMGGVEVYVFPDSLTVVSFPGRQPYWQQQ
jgi:hypothetical protein